MKRLNSILKRSGAAFLATLWCTSPVWGDDTEIFFGDVDSANARTNVLFIIDTSGSMGSGVVPSNGKDRLDNVKDAFYTLMDELNNVNVGLMRFTNPGGPVLYPVTNIDEEVPSGVITTVVGDVQAGNDDAQQFVGGTNAGLMVLDSEFLQVGEISLGGTEIFEDRISPASGEDDDRTERLNPGDQQSPDTWLYIGAPDSSFPNRLGLRFTGATIPAGATITNAYVRLYGKSSSRDNGNDIDLVISGELVDSGDFQGVANYNVRDRTRTSDGVAVDWEITPLIADRESIDTPNLKDIIQEIIQQGSWVAGTERDIVILIDPPAGSSGGGVRAFYPRNASSTYQARLFVEYSTGPIVTGTGTTGLRFDNLDIPRGVTVTEAYLEFTAYRDFASAHDLTIKAELPVNGDSAQFSSTAGDITGRSKSNAINWTGSVSASQGDVFQSPNIKAIIEEATAEGTDWCGGNALSLFVDGTGELPVWAFEGSGSLSPKLVVKYEYDSIPNGTSCLQRTITRSVSRLADDVEDSATNASLNGNTLNLESGNLVGLRFENLDIPKFSPVSSATLRMVAQDNSTGAATIEVSAETSPTPESFTGTSGTVSGRFWSASTPWDITSAWSSGSSYEVSTPGLATLVSDAVSQTGWTLGGAIALQLETTSGIRGAKSNDRSPGEAPELTVTFTDDGSGVQRRRTRDVLKEIVSGLNHSGWTPIQDTLYEAALYYTGGKVKWGATRGAEEGPFNYARISAAESMVDGTYSIYRPSGCTDSNLNSTNCRQERINTLGVAQYKTPIDDFCQAESHIILLTDGEANLPHSANLIDTFIDGDGSCQSDGSVRSGERCVKELASHMYNNDMRPDDELPGDQIIKTHTIGFSFSSPWLTDVAVAGGGVATTASDTDTLVQAIKDILGEVLKTDSTFVAPVAAVNQFNQLSHLAQVYFAVFRPDELPRWRGNLKKYTLSEEGVVIEDAKPAPAIDPSTGFFVESSRSFWSSLEDGDKVDLGGAAENVPDYLSRNVFTYYSGSTSTNLASSVNAISTSNTNLTASMLGVPGFNASQVAEHIEWIRGRDVDDENDENGTTDDRYVFGDPLHSRPVAITYGGTEESPDVEVFFGTNSGAIQSVDAATGIESFAFIPEALLPMQYDLRQNLATTAHPYGIDGTVSPWFNDNGRDGIDPSDPDDFVRIYTGMRRGGRSYYALDVTDRSNPEMMWQINGGTASGTNDFRELGQTWSRPIKTQIIIDGDTAPRDVLLFSGGYDEAQDSAELRTADSIGRGMYIVDAVTGDLIWSGGKTGAQSWVESYSAMDYSFPSDMSVVDINQDGLADMWFGADTGGQLWRFDIQNGQTLANLVTGGVIADLGVAAGTNTKEDNRRFFASPSVALIRGPDGPELAVAIGSGSRPSPLSVLATNRMYLIRQQAVFAAPSSYVAVTRSDLYDATSNTLATATGSALETEQALLYNAQGWFFGFPRSGEKVLSSPLIANDRVIFTTYTPGNSGVWCRPAAGTSRAYSVRLEDAVRTEPRPLLTPSIVDQATIIVPPPYVPDPNAPEDPNDPDDPNDPGSACPNGNNVVIKLNAEDGPIDDWCNDASKTYWVKEQ